MIYVVAFLGIAFLLVVSYALLRFATRPPNITQVTVLPAKVDYSWNAVGKRIVEKGAINIATTLATFGLAA